MDASSTHPKWTPYVFIAPFVLLFAIFVIYPLFQSVTLALHQTFGPKRMVFVGMKNFQDLFFDPLFWKAMRNTFVYAAASVSIQLPLSLGLAMLLNNPSVKARAFFRLIFFSPALVGIVFVAIIFTEAFEKSNGLLNVILRNFIPNYPPEVAWLETWILPALIIASLWMYVGFNMIYFLAALQNVPRDLTEAAMIDGAGPWQRFKNVTLPAIKPIAGFVVLISALGSFQLFELPFVLLGGPGPNDGGLTVVMYLYSFGFQDGSLGYASAIGWSLAVVLIILTIIQRKLTKEEH